MSAGWRGLEPFHAHRARRVSVRGRRVHRKRMRTRPSGKARGRKRIAQKVRDQK
jgi:hypothetical protein